MENKEIELPENAKHLIEVEIGDRTVKAYLSKPDRNLISKCLIQMRTQGDAFDMITIGEMILRSTFLHQVSDREIIEDEDCLISASIQAFGLIELLSSTRKKL